MNEFFYGAVAPEFINSTSAQQVIQDPKLYIDSTKSEVKPAPKEEKKPDDKNKPIVMSVSLCCNSCVEYLEPLLKRVKGVTKVECEVYKKRVTVTGTASVADILSVTRKRFPDAQLKT